MSEGLVFKGVLAEDIFQKIGRKGNLRTTAKESGVSASTLSRAINEKDLSLESFARICKWLQRSPVRYFDLGELE